MKELYSLFLGIAALNNSYMTYPVPVERKCVIIQSFIQSETAYLSIKVSSWDTGLLL